MANETGGVTVGHWVRDPETANVLEITAELQEKVWRLERALKDIRGTASAEYARGIASAALRYEEER